MPSPWVRWSCTKCDVGVSLRANSKGGAPWHHCYRNLGKWMPLTKETNDQTNPGGGGPAGSSPGSDARTERSDSLEDIKRDGFYLDGDVWRHNDPRVTAFRDGINHHLNYHGPTNYDHGCPACRTEYHTRLYRDSLARAGGFGTYAGFLAFCEWVCGVHDAG